MAQFCGDDCDDFTIFKKLQTVFKQLGACMVLEMSTFTAISLELAYFEFRERYTTVNATRIEAYLTKVAAAKQTEAANATDEEEKKQPAEESKSVPVASQKFYKKAQEMPIIASECPGWVCYAEKRVGDLALPFMSKTKSPQQICGILSKLFLGKRMQATEDGNVSTGR